MTARSQVMSVWLCVVLCSAALACGDDDSAGGPDAAQDAGDASAEFDARDPVDGSEPDASDATDAADAQRTGACPLMGRPVDGTPCTHPGALCYYDGELTGQLVFECVSGSCPDAPCNAVFTECEGAAGFQHWDSASCDGGI